MTRNAIGKGLALCSSLLLAGCFVAYRQNQAGKTDEPAVMPGSKNPVRGLARFPMAEDDFVSPEPGKPASTSKPEVQKTVFPSSKSIDAILRPADLPKEPKASPERALLPGSKAMSSGDAPINRNDIDEILNGRRKSAEQTKEPEPASEP